MDSQESLHDEELCRTSLEPEEGQSFREQGTASPSGGAPGRPCWCEGPGWSPPCCRGEVSCVSSLGGEFLGKALRVPSHWF